VRPEGWSDAFPVTFEHRAKNARALSALKGIQFQDGAPLLDRERVANASHSPGDARGTLSAHSFVASYNNHGPGSVKPYETEDVHGRFPFGHFPFVTAVGRGATWVADERPAGYKVMYQCLDARAPDAEAAAPHGGVPSGSGWHKIGDQAETLVNDLEGAPFFVGAAKVRPLGVGALASGFAWGLEDVVTLRWLSHGEAFITQRGGFHWFAVPVDKPSCVQILVSPEGHADPT
jgi:hypothetical protein